MRDYIYKCYKNRGIMIFDDFIVFYFFVVSNISFYFMKVIFGMFCLKIFFLLVGRCFFSLIWIIVDCEELLIMYLLLMGYIYNVVNL